MKNASFRQKLLTSFLAIGTPPLKNWTRRC